MHSIRNRLTALKKNRGEYIKASDVNVLYQATVKQGASPTLWSRACIRLAQWQSHFFVASINLSLLIRSDTAERGPR